MNLITSISFMLVALCDPFSHPGNISYIGHANPDSAIFAESAYLHVDRDYYSPGDDIWFKSYVIDASTNKLSSITRNLHVELISPSARIIQSCVLRIENGTGNGDFHLPDSLPSGRYTIRAYTNFMRNFDDNFFFNKEIIVVNSADGGNELKDSIEYVRNALDITFLPEGGSLVDDITSTIAFKAVNALGKGCDVTGELFSSKGDLVTSFHSTHLGMGSFGLKPDPGLSYYARIKTSDGGVYKADIPKSFSTGISIHTLMLKNNQLLLTVNTNEKTLPSIIDHELIITLCSRNLFSETTKIKTGALITNFILPIDDFPDGIIRVTLSGADGLPLCERLIYLQKRNDVYVKVTTDKQQYSTREEVKMKLSLAGDTVHQEKAFLSLSATDYGMTADSSIYPTSISSWFLLESDVHGLVEKPSCYFDISNQNRFEELDLLLLTQGWRDFKWKYDTTNLFRYENGFSISGMVRKLFFDKPISGTRINIGVYSENKPMYLITTPDSAGYFRVDGIDITGKARVIASVTGKKEKFQGMILLDSMRYEPAGISLMTADNEALLPVDFPKRRQEVTFISAERKKYKLSDTISIGEVIVTANKPDSPQTIRINKGRAGYGTPDRELIITPEMDNKYPDLFRLATSNIQRVNWTGSGITIGGLNPKILLDGMEIPEMDYDLVKGIPANMIDRIDVIDKPLGKMINFITKAELTAVNKQPLHSVSFIIKGYDSPRLFYSPKHKKPDEFAFMPDTRSTIFWEPNILTGKENTFNISYFNADKATIIKIIVEGITSEGIPVTGKLRYEVK